jgi:hypothetical protein
MAESYTIEPAHDGEAIDPGLLRELRDMLRADDDLDLGIRLKDRPPAPGEQGAIPLAVEIVAAATPLGTAFAGVLRQWINKHKVSIRVRRQDGTSLQLSAGNVQDAERLIALLESGSGAEPDAGD